ncbi:MAG TPA: acyltransferase [Xanthobacteraceae bacterium]|nr:acyltransferase [Xanthobacteraceae bacterium]
MQVISQEERTRTSEPLRREAAASVPRARTDPSRIGYVDAVRVILIMLVVAHHSVESYVTAHPPEIPLPDPPLARGVVFLWVNAAFFMGLFFFLAGYFTSGAFDRKGALAFLADRGLRLGLPLALGTVLIAPLAGWAHIALDPAMPPVGYWTYLTQDFFGRGPRPEFWPEGARWPGFQFGHLWFLEHLLIYALLYAALRALLPRDRGLAAKSPPSHAAIAGYAVLLAATTFVIRIWYPQNRWIGFLGFIQMEPAHIAQYASLFAIGIFAGPRRWLDTIPRRRGLVWLAIGAGLALVAYLAAGTGATGSAGATGGFDSRNWRVCTYEAFLCVGLCVGLPVLCRELALGTGRLWRMLAANVYAVYVFHFPIVLLLQWALIEAPVPKWVRLGATVVVAILSSFAFTNWVILRLPYARRVF